MGYEEEVKDSKEFLVRNMEEIVSLLFDNYYKYCTKEQVKDLLEINRKVFDSMLPLIHDLAEIVERLQVEEKKQFLLGKAFGNIEAFTIYFHLLDKKLKEKVKEV